MTFLDIFRKKGEEGEISEDYAPTISANEAEVAINNANNKVNPNFKGEVEIKEVKFPKELGEEHPFDFATMEGVHRKFGFVNGVVDKFIDFVIGPGFYVVSENEKAQEICEQFIQDVNFDTILRAWIKEALIKGSGFLELGGKRDEVPKGLKVLNANYMYIKRDKFGKIEKYNQYTGGFKRFEKSKMIPFEPYQVALIPFNRTGDCAYGLGVISPALITINNILQSSTNLHMLMDRKANVPIHAKLGTEDKRPKKEDIEAFGKKLEWMHNKHEWATDALVDMKVLDFGNIGEKFETVLQYDTDMLFYTFQVPAVLMGQAKVPEGLAKVQLDAFERRILSIQAEVEKVIEKHIFRRVLQANGFDDHVEFEWGRPSSLETMERLKLIAELIKSPVTSRALSQLLEMETVQLLGLPEDEYEELKQTEDEERRREEERSQAIVPGQNASPPKFVPKKKPEERTREWLEKELDKMKPLPLAPAGNEMILPKFVDEHKHGGEEEYVCPHCLDIKEGMYNTITEWLGFKYNDYVKEILIFLSGEDFDLVRAKTVVEEAAGKLTSVQITGLREVLEKGFKENQSIRDMSEAMDKKVKPKDLYRMKDGKIVKKAGIPILARSAEERSIAIVRSEVTRAANEGAMRHFKEGGITKIRWVASAGTRTCPDCEALNGRIFGINDHPPIPLHTMCRCTVLPVTEII